ncbi:MAG: Histone deacetylase hda1, partial [Pleopsidium flavum]
NYIEWSVKQGFGVIDVNIPKHITGHDDTEGYVEEDRPKRISATEELAVYLWENYIECNDATEIFFIGVGDAFHGITHLLMNREHCFERITGIVNFVAENPLRPVQSQNIYWLSKWYIEHSLIYVSSTHLVWAPETPTKKLSKRFGKLVKSPMKGLNEMLERHHEEVEEWILERVERGRAKGKGKMIEVDVDATEMAGI